MHSRHAHEQRARVPGPPLHERRRAGDPRGVQPHLRARRSDLPPAHAGRVALAVRAQSLRPAHRSRGGGGRPRPRAVRRHPAAGPARRPADFLQPVGRLDVRSRVPAPGARAALRAGRARLRHGLRRRGAGEGHADVGLTGAGRLPHRQEAAQVRARATAAQALRAARAHRGAGEPARGRGAARLPGGDGRPPRARRAGAARPGGARPRADELALRGEPAPPLSHRRGAARGRARRRGGVPEGRLRSGRGRPPGRLARPGRGRGRARGAPRLARRVLARRGLRAPDGALPRHRARVARLPAPRLPRARLALLPGRLELLRAPRPRLDAPALVLHPWGHGSRMSAPERNRAELELVPWHPGDPPALEALGQEARGRFLPRSAAQWDWAFRRNPAGTRLWLARRGGRIVARYGALPVRTRVMGETRTFANLIDGAAWAGEPEGDAWLALAQAFLAAHGGPDGDLVHYGWPDERELSLGKAHLEHELLRVTCFLAREPGSGPLGLTDGRQECEGVGA